MKTNFKKFDLKIDKLIPIDEFFEKVLYKPNIGYYSKQIPFGKQGDFVTSPTISNLFSEIIGIWIVSAWEKLGKPKKFNLVELGPGDGSLAKILLRTFQKFPEFNKAIKIFMYEKSRLLIKTQKNKIDDKRVSWIKNFNSIKTGPIIFFGNEFFDAIPIKQFIFKKEEYKERYFLIKKNNFREIYKKAFISDVIKIRSFKSLNKLRFIEYPKLGFKELDKMVQKISIHSGGILLIDYGYLKSSDKNTLQAIMKNKKVDMDQIYKNLGKIDITSLVNFNLLKEYFLKKNLKLKKIVSQKFFLEKMGIMERAKILKSRMTFAQQNYMSLTLYRLLHKRLMGNLFKVIFAYKSNKSNFLGFK
tara:strand:+ start:3497 stop:4573 length:1077 start_codon:yes stop_codon:yes gene_type:complete